MLESSTNRLEFSAISSEIFRDKIFNTAGFEFRGQFPYLDKLQYTRFVQWVESQSDYQKFNSQCLVFNKYIYIRNSICSFQCINLVVSKNTYIQFVYIYTIDLKAELTVYLVLKVLSRVVCFVASGRLLYFMVHRTKKTADLYSQSVFS